MRIAFVVGTFPELSSTFILDQVTGLLDRGHDVQVFARAPSRREPSHAAVSAYGLAARTHHWWGRPELAPRILGATGRLLRAAPLAHGRVLARALNVRRLGSYGLGRTLSYAATLLAERPFDVVLAQFGTNGRVAATLRELGAFDAPIATTWLGYDLSRVIKQHGSDYYRALFAEGERMLPLSDHFRTRLIALGCPAEKILVHHVGVDLAKFSYSPRTLAPGVTTRLLTVCRLVEKKGIVFALQALARVAAEGLPFEYHLVGDGPERTRIEAARQELGLTRQVTLHGVKTREEVTALLAHAHLFLSPSVTAADGDEEGVPAAIKEAMACGLPILSTHHAAIPELVREGVSGHLVPEWDVEQLARQTAKLLREPSRWPALGQAGRRTIESEYDLAQLNDRLSSELERLARAYVPRAPRSGG